MSTKTARKKSSAKVQCLCQCGGRATIQVTVARVQVQLGFPRPAELPGAALSHRSPISLGLNLLHRWLPACKTFLVRSLEISLNSPVGLRISGTNTVRLHQIAG